jgi:hypothetical protein
MLVNWGVGLRRGVALALGFVSPQSALFVRAVDLLLPPLPRRFFEILFHPTEILFPLLLPAI